MPAIAKNNDVVTVIVIFSVEPERQQELVDSIVEFVESAVKQQPGFVSASIHRSIDGIRVMNYAQWKSQKDYQAFVQNSAVQSLGAKLSKFPKPDSHLYEVVVSVPEDATLKISKGGLIHLAEFSVKPENQQRLVELERENVFIALDHPDLISANFHRSLDGVRTVNYGQWRSLENFELLLKEPKYTPLSEYWRGLAEKEFHLYEVVFTEPKSIDSEKLWEVLTLLHKSNKPKRPGLIQVFVEKLKLTILRKSNKPRRGRSKRQSQKGKSYEYFLDRQSIVEKLLSYDEDILDCAKAEVGRQIQDGRIFVTILAGFGAVVGYLFIGTLAQFIILPYFAFIGIFVWIQIARRYLELSLLKQALVLNNNRSVNSKK